MPQIPRHMLMDDDGEWCVTCHVNTVTIIGPKTDIDSFRELCIVDASPCGGEGAFFDLDRIIATPANLFDLDKYIWRSENWGTDREPKNFIIANSLDPCILSLYFESAWGFPKPIFNLLAERFHRLAFHCFSLELNHTYMEIGWFNTPKGCDDFHVDRNVPQNCPEDGPRPPISEIRHQRVLSELMRLAREADDIS